MKSGYDAIDHLQRSATALFLDFDGTLAEIVDRPDGVSVKPGLLATLSQLRSILDGAVAIVTGREISAIDRFLSPHIFAVSGVHGYETRDTACRLQTLPIDTNALASIAAQLRLLQSQHDGLILEEKAASIALHYRQRPDLAELCHKTVEKALVGHHELRVLHGKAVIEIKAHKGNKGTAIEDLLRTPSFMNRTPVFIGDDVTDEAAFAVVNAHEGVSIKVGTGLTAAAYHLTDPASVRAWLSQLAQRLASGPNQNTCLRT